MRWVVVLGLAACGRAGVEPSGLAPEQDSTAVSTPASSSPGAYGPWDCSLSCERVKTQLVRDFGVPPPVHCWEWDLVSAGSASACDCAFQRRWGVSTAGSPASCP